MSQGKVAARAAVSDAGMVAAAVVLLRGAAVDIVCCVAAVVIAVLWNTWSCRPQTEEKRTRGF